MSKLISLDNGIAWIEQNDQVFGIVNAFKVLDFDGLVYPDQSVTDLLDCDQDYDLECNVISFEFENGESAELRIYNDTVELVSHND